MALTPKDLNAVKSAVSETIRSEFLRIGLATDDDNDAIDAQADFRFLRQKRQETEKTHWLIRSRIVSLLVGAAGSLGLLGAGALLHGGGAQPPTVP